MSRAMFATETFTRTCASRDNRKEVRARATRRDARREKRTAGMTMGDDAWVGFEGFAMSTNARDGGASASLEPCDG